MKLNEGTHRTLWRTRLSKILTVPICVTKAVSPFGRLTCVFRVAVIEVKQDTECIIWPVAHVSMTQSNSLKASLLMVFTEKTGCFKVGMKGIL